ncbi:MAG: hypothetical protein GY833_22780 [Aestuariibacter sp.]|nr:hypothetical protein [Aestuariibacter sp.]|tara:strand:+ start:211662 stop:212222 length:561 start_codon:yes stop_codon:yes gene_type:complete
MSDELRWVNPRFASEAGAMAATAHGHFPVLFFSTDSPEDVLARLENKTYTRSDYINMFSGNQTLSPNRGTFLDRLSVSESGNLALVISADKNEALYAAIDKRQASDEGTLRTFAVVISDLDTYMGLEEKGQASSYPRKVPYTYIVGTVGTYQSGADIEFEALDQWKLGRPLYIENNQLEIPFRVLR